MKKLLSAAIVLAFYLGWSAVLPAKDYRGAELRTKASYLYGRFEVRYKAAWGSGLTSTFFTYNDIDPNEKWNEIDIEIMGRYTDDVQFNAITPGVRSHIHHQFVPFDPSLDFHTYAIEWTPQYVAWFVDGEEVYRQTGPHIAQLTRPQKIMMNIWQPIYTDWAGDWDEAILPAFAYYDYVSYAKYSPDSGTVGTDNNFLPVWKDDFDAYDASRWDRATHTWNGNNCDFRPENIVFRDGLMILCLTDPTHLGYVDARPPKVLWARYQWGKVLVQYSEAVDPSDAETVSNYVIPGVTVQAAKLSADGRQVILTTGELTPGQYYNLIVAGIRDLPPGHNKLMGQSVPIIVNEPLSFPVKINVGGPATLGYLGDQRWSENVEYGYEDGKEAAINSAQPIANTDEDAIYQTERWGLARYNIRVPNGSYRVRLMMAENFFSQPGRRSFDVHVEGKLVADDLDLYQKAGIHAAYDIVVEPVEVKDEKIDIHFGANVNFAVLNGIVVEPIQSKVGQNQTSPPQGFELLTGFPNPFRQQAIIPFILREPGEVSLQIFNAAGQLVAKREHRYAASGSYQMVVAPSGASGIYFCRLEFRGKVRRTVRSVKLVRFR